MRAPCTDDGAAMNATVAFATANDYAFESIRVGAGGVAFDLNVGTIPAFLEGGSWKTHERHVHEQVYRDVRRELWTSGRQ